MGLLDFVNPTKVFSNPLQPWNLGRGGGGGILGLALRSDAVRNFFEQQRLKQEDENRYLASIADGSRVVNQGNSTAGYVSPFAKATAVAPRVNANIPAVQPAVVPAPITPVAAPVSLPNVTTTPATTSGVQPQFAPATTNNNLFGTPQVIASDELAGGDFKLPLNRIF